MPIVGDSTIGGVSSFSFFLMRRSWFFYLAKLADRPWGRIGKLLECIQAAEQEMLQRSQLMAMLQARDFWEKQHVGQQGFFWGYNMNILNHIRKNNQGHVGLQSLIFMGK